MLSPLDVLRRRHGAVPAVRGRRRSGRRRSPTARGWSPSRMCCGRPGGRSTCRRSPSAVHAVGGAAAGRRRPVGRQHRGRRPATGADFYALSGQKWLLGPQGSGALWVSPELTPRVGRDLRLPEPGGGRDRASSRRRAGRFDGGIERPGDRRRFTAAIEWVEGLPGGRAGWSSRSPTNAAAARERLAEVPGVRARAGQRQRPDRVHPGGRRGHRRPWRRGSPSGRARALHPRHAVDAGLGGRVDDARGRRARWRAGATRAGRARPRSGAVPRSRTRCARSDRRPAPRRPRVTSSRLTPRAKLGCFSFLRTDLGSSVAIPSGRTSPQAWTKPASSSHA